MEHQKQNKRSYNTKKHVSAEPSRTIRISNVYMDDLESFGNGNNIARHLQERRQKHFSEIINKMGRVETVDYKLPKVFVTFESREDAEEAMNILFGTLEVVTLEETGEEKQKINKDRLIALMRDVENELQADKLSKSICPNFLRYKCGWAANALKPKTSNAKKGVTKSVKNVIADPQRSDKVQANKNVVALSTRASKPVAPTATKAPRQPKPVATLKELQSNAEVAIIKRELQYIEQQAHHVVEEIRVENERSADRAKRMVYLAEQLKNSEAQLQSLRVQHLLEQQLQATSEARIESLEDEYEHFYLIQEPLALRLCALQDAKENISKYVKFLKSKNRNLDV